MRSIVALIMIAVFASYAIRSRYAGMLMYWWFGIFRPQEWMWWDLSSLRLPLIAFALFVGPTLVNGILPRLRSSISWLMLFWLVLAIIAFTLNGCDYRGPEALKRMITLVVVIWLTEQLIKDEKKILGLIFTVGISLLYFSAKAGLYSLTSGTTLYDVYIVGGTFTGSNAFAMGTAMLFFFMVFSVQNVFNSKALAFMPKWVSKKHFRIPLQFYLIYVLIFSAYAVVSTESRGSFLALALGCFVWIALHPKKVRIFLGIAIVGAMTLAVVGLPESYSDRIKSAFADEEELDKSAASRPHFWKVARIMASHHVLGVGTGCYSSYYDQFDTTDGEFGHRRSVHGSHFQILAETGYLGMGTWILLLLLSAWKLWRFRASCIKEHEHNPRDWFFFYLSNALLASLICFCFGGSFYEIAHNDIVWLIFGLAASLPRIKQELEDRDKPAEPETPAPTPKWA